MTKVLQLRRGTTAQNDAFTGLAGELTMDTESKTLRIHDGETLGGFTVGNGENNTATGAGTFDITTVPDEFWAEIVTKHSKTQSLSVIETNPVKTRNGGSIVTHVIEQEITPVYVQPCLVCTADADGYVTGDITQAFGIGNRPGPAPYTYIYDHKLCICMMVGGENYWVSHKNTGVTTNIDNNNWSIMFRVYY